MNQLSIILFVITSTLALTTISCKKEEGYGGLASVSGRVYAHDYSNSGELLSEGYAGDIEVYIKAKDGKEVIDRIRTIYDGYFQFAQLRKGNYEVWVYSDCKACPNGVEAIIQEVKVADKKSKIELPAFEINI
ncbi:MAG: hypothetical protein LC105_00870 [Chitinophagales bacterium]|nr:hypothetical protein [Chitinophagales bacterium]MCZ2392397.1 hypothetical protein [Chitinophagales bacterium]